MPAAPATGSAAPLLQLLHLGPRDIAARSPLEVRIQAIGVPHDHRAGLEARHPFFETAFGNGLDEILLAEHLEALDQRRADQALLIRPVTAIARSGPPG